MNKVIVFIIIIFITSNHVIYASFPLDKKFHNEIQIDLFDEINIPDCTIEWLLDFFKFFLSALVLYLVVFSPWYHAGLPEKVKHKFLFRYGFLLMITLSLLWFL